MNSFIFDVRERAILHHTAQSHFLTWPTGLHQVLVLVLQALIVSLLVAFELRLFYEIYSFIKQAMPGEDTTMSVAILAMTGFVALMMLHVRMAQAKGTWPERLIRILVDLLLPVFLLSAGLLFACMVYDDGLGALIGADHALLTAVNGFLGNETTGLARSEASLAIEVVKPWIGLVFLVGIAGLSLFSIFASHYFIDQVIVNLRQFLDDLARNFRARKVLRKIEQLESVYRQQTHELALLTSVSAEDALAESVQRVVTLIAGPLQIAEGWIAQRELNPTHPDVVSPSIDPVLQIIQTLDLQELKQRVTALRALDEATLTTIMTGETQ